MKNCLTCVLLCTAIILIAIGVHTDNIILISIGGASAGVYNAMICERYKKK